MTRVCANSSREVKRGCYAKQMALKVRLGRILTNVENCNKQGSFARSKRLNETLGTLPAVSYYVRKRISSPLAQVRWNINLEPLQTRVDTCVLIVVCVITSDQLGGSDSNRISSLGLGDFFFFFLFSFLSLERSRETC